MMGLEYSPVLQAGVPPAAVGRVHLAWIDREPFIPRAAVGRRGYGYDPKAPPGRILPGA